jgi:hypothetical protein
VPVHNGFNQLYAANVAGCGVSAYRKNPVFSWFFSCFFEIGVPVSGRYFLLPSQWELAISRFWLAIK